MGIREKSGESLQMAVAHILNEAEHEMVEHLAKFYPQCAPVVDWALREREQRYNLESGLKQLMKDCKKMDMVPIPLLRKLLRRGDG